MLSHRVHSPLCRSPLQSSFNPITARSFRNKQLPTLVFALTRRHHDLSTHAAVPKPSATFCPQVFSTSRQFALSRGLRVYFTSLPSSGPTCSGIYPLCTATLSSSARSSLLVVDSKPTLLPERRSPCALSSTSRFLSMQSHVSQVPGFSCHRDRAPLQVCILRRCLLLESQLPNSPFLSTPESTISPESDFAEPTAKHESYNRKRIDCCQSIILLRIRAYHVTEPRIHSPAPLRKPSTGPKSLSSRKKRASSNRGLLIP